MAGLVKELLLDYALNRLSVDLRSDLTIALQSALSSFTPREAKYLDMYLSGYNAIEIAAHYTETTDSINQALERLFTAVEETSGYTDENFIHKLELSKRYRKGGIRDLGYFLFMHSKDYLSHDMKEE